MEHEQVQRVAESLVRERTVDIVTVGRRTGRLRTTEIWTTVVDGEIYITGTPGASREGLEHQPRDWLANVRARPAFTLRLKQSVDVDLDAVATEVVDPAVKRAVFAAPQCAYYRRWSRSVEHFVATAPMIHVTLTGDGASVQDAVRSSRANSPTA